MLPGLSKVEGEVILGLYGERRVNHEIKYDHNIWLKFVGGTDDPIDGDDPFPLIRVPLSGKMVYVQNYPWKPSLVNDGDEVYLAAFSTDSSGKTQPIIMGRGFLKSFHPTNFVDGGWLVDNDWMMRFPWFCVLEDAELLDTSIRNGIPLDSIYMNLGSDTYLTSLGKNENISTVAKKHHKKAHIRLTGTAKQLIDQMFNPLAEKYGLTILDGFRKPYRRLQQSSHLRSQLGIKLV